MNKEIKTYELVVNCKKRLRAEIEDIKIPRIRRNQEFIDQGVINERGRKILSIIINEINKKRNQKAEFWVKISESSKEKIRGIQSTWILHNLNIKFRYKSPTWSSRLKEILIVLTYIAL
ncbi:38749_t:CDS:2, partial [Gigaspora margarita]